MIAESMREGPARMLCDKSNHNRHPMTVFLRSRGLEERWGGEPARENIRPQTAVAGASNDKADRISFKEKGGAARQLRRVLLKRS